MAQGIGPNSPQFYNPKLWDEVRNHAAEGLSRAETAKRIGYRPDYFCKLLINNPDKDPFDPYGVVANYVRDTGERFHTALCRMAKAGLCMTHAAQLIGFTSKHALAYAMRVRGINVEFPKYKRPAAAKPVKVNDGLSLRRTNTGLSKHPWKQEADREAAEQGFSLN